MLINIFLQKNEYHFLGSKNLFISAERDERAANHRINDFEGPELFPSYGFLFVSPSGFTCLVSLIDIL